MGVSPPRGTNCRNSHRTKHITLREGLSPSDHPSSSARHELYNKAVEGRGKYPVSYSVQQEKNESMEYG